MLTRLRANKELAIQPEIASRLTAVTGPIAAPQRHVAKSLPPTEARLLLADGTFVTVLNCVAPEHITIGRARDSGVRLLDLSVSRNHAGIRWDVSSAAHVLVDRDSANGTFVDGARIHSAVALRDGMLVKFGGLLLRYLLIRPDE